MTNAELIAALRVEPFEVGSFGLAQIINQAADLIEAQAKRIEELEAQLPKEGEWVGRQKHRRCSICGFSTWYDFALDCELTSPFCPECGARMKGEQE